MVALKCIYFVVNVNVSFQMFISHMYFISKCLLYYLLANLHLAKLYCQRKILTKWKIILFLKD